MPTYRASDRWSGPGLRLGSQDSHDTVRTFSGQPCARNEPSSLFGRNMTKPRRFGSSIQTIVWM
jgi:hypothetical protein